MVRLIDAVHFREKLLEFRSKAVDKWGKDGTARIAGIVDSVVKKIDDTPTIAPESLWPTAHWECLGEVEALQLGSKYAASYCSRCRGRVRCRSDYCPHCGAKMEG